MKGLALVVLLGAAVAAGCRGDGWGGTVSTLPNGGRLVENPATGMWTPESGWRIVEDLRIGRADGDGPDVFSVVFAFDVDADGNIYAFDLMSRELRVFDADGRFVRSFGRRGGGPGEFEAVIGLRVGSANDVWLVDMHNMRYTVLRGDSAAVYPRPRGMYRPPWIGGFTAAGTFHDIVLLPAGEVFVRVNASGQVVDTVRLPQPELNLPRRGVVTFDLPFGVQNLRAFDNAGRLWLGNTHEYRIHRVDLPGDTSLVITHPATPRPLSGVERDSVTRYARLLETELRMTVSSDMLPRDAPLLDWLAVDGDGFIWVGIATPPGEPSQADIFDVDGRYLGRVTMPFTSMRALPPRFRGSHLYTVAHDELGTPVLVRARIEKPAG